MGDTHLSAVHIIDVGPDGLQGDVGSAVVVDDLGHVEDVLVAVAALVEPEAPVGDHGRSPDDVSVLPGDVVRGGPRQEVEVQDAAERVVFEKLPVVVGTVDNDVHTVRVQKEDAVRARRSMLVVDGVRAVEIRAFRDRVGVSRPDGADVVRGPEPKGIGMLPEAVQIRVLG